MLTLVASILLGLSAMAPSPADSVDFRLADHRWEHRPLLVFAPSADHDFLTAHEKALEGNDAGIRDRDMILVTVVEDGTSRLRMAPSDDGRPLTDAAVRRLRDRFSVPPAAFRVILVGKDGTEKQRSAEPVSIRSIFDRIDAMPMRQREMDGG
jgi:hypothetical protein